VTGNETPPSNARVTLRIGTRGSRLALAQAAEVIARLAAIGIHAEPVPMVTSGDRGAPAEGSSAGVKGLFVAEIVRALQEGEVDLAVHSAKDLPAQDPEGVLVAAVPERADPFDVLVTRDGQLEEGAVVGTSSLRRRAQLLRNRPGLRVQDLRGNVDTRLSKLEAGEVDGLVLAAAGLERLGLTPETAWPLPVEEMVPAPGQGALAVQARANDDPVLEAVRAIDHPRSRLAFEAERRLMQLIGGGCALPLGAYAERRDAGVRLLAVVVRPDGTDLVWAQAEARTPDEVAAEVALTLEEGGARDILAELLGGSV
jgi:hydroxymethylbilane synthase